MRFLSGRAAMWVNVCPGAASLALTLKVQRAKHAINDNYYSYAVEKPLKPIRVKHTKKNLMTIPQRATHAQCEILMGINGFGGH